MKVTVMTEKQYFLFVARSYLLPDIILIVKFDLPQIVVYGYDLWKIGTRDIACRRKLF